MPKFQTITSYFIPIFGAHLKSKMTLYGIKVTRVNKIYIDEGVLGGWEGWGAYIY